MGDTTKPARQRTHRAGPAANPGDFDRLRAAVAAGPEAVLEAAVPLLAAVAGTDRAALASADGMGWQVVAGDTGLREDDGAALVTIRPGRLAALLPCPPLFDVSAAVAAVDLALAAAERAREAGDVLAELQAQQNVALDILSVREIDQVLLSISHEALGLLDADMSGVLLLEEPDESAVLGPELVMRSCQGQRSLQTARLRMRAGHGVAGRALETGQTCKVDSYLDSEAITHDFDALARLEDTRCALAAPLKAHGTIIGVLEVWRRRQSVFTEQQVRRIEALANLATIAIENARLYQSQQEALRQLAGAQESLGHQLQALKGSATMQRALTQLLLEGEGLASIVRTIASQIEGQVSVYGVDFEPLAWYPRAAATDLVAAELRRLAPGLETTSGATTVRLAAGTPDQSDRWLTVQAVRAGRDRLGWFCLLSAHAPSTARQLVIGEAVLSCALSQLEQRAAEQARSETRDEILADLLEGSDDRRQAAVDRARRIHIDLARPHRVLRGDLDGLEAVAEAEGWDTAHVERLRRDLRGMAQRVVAAYGCGELVSVRGQSIFALLACNKAAEARAVVEALGTESERILPGANAVWGLSSSVASPAAYRRSNTEAQIALRAARRLGEDRIALYDQLGVVRLLLASDQGSDLGEYVTDVIGPLIEHDRKHDASLVATLRAYFECDCSQLQAAKQLFVHHKTLRYRLERIESLTSLQLRKHEDRIRADLALKIYEVMEMNKTWAENPSG